MRLVVYGTLREGGALTGHMPKGGKYETLELPKIRLYVLGDFPGAKLGTYKDKAIVELWEFNLTRKTEKKWLTYLDIIEGVHYGLYKRSYIDTPKGKAVIYTFCGNVDGYPRIKDWKEWQKKSKKEKTLLMKTGTNTRFVISRLK